MTVQSPVEPFFSEPLSSRDPEVRGGIGKELGRARHEIELITSENLVSAAVLEAQRRGRKRRD